MKKKIDEMFAFIADDGSGEGVIGMSLPGLGFSALVGADMDRVESLKPYAQMIADNSGVEVKLAVFKVRYELETIKPRGKDERRKN